MSRHFRLECWRCGAIFSQCRCPGEKTTTYTTCGACVNNEQRCKTCGRLGTYKDTIFCLEHKRARDHEEGV